MMSVNDERWKIEQDKYQIFLKQCLEAKQRYRNSLIMVNKQHQNLRNLYQQMQYPNGHATFNDIQLKVQYLNQNNQEGLQNKFEPNNPV